MRKNQKGFTLVELIIAVAILAIVTLSVCGFIVVGSRSYTSANTDIMLQQEAQLALNQISDVIIDTTESINYGSGTEMVLKDSEFSSEPDEKDLVVINSHDGLNPTDSSLQNNNFCYQFEWRKDTETIYFRDSEAVITESHPKPEEGEWNDWAILAQHVKELHIDISQFEENRVVMISMTFQNGNKEYTTSNNVTVRNRIAINKIDIEPMKKAQEFTITTVKNIILEPGDIFNLATQTQVQTTSGDDAVKWELVDPGTTTSTISSDGQLSIGIGETRESFLVKVIRVNEEYANQNDKVAKTVKVRIKRANTVNLSCSETTIKPGSTVTVDGSAVGYLLGSKCNACSLETDEELNKDHDLVSTISAAGWTIVRGPATIESADSKKAEVKILSTAKKGDEIEIEARAVLPDKKGYGPVTGRLVLTVTEGTMGDIPLQSGFKFGTNNDDTEGSHMTLDYLFDGILPNYSHYIICVRVRELDAASGENDQVVVYDPHVGKNVRFHPDIFGLELNRSYNVFIQILLPVPSKTIEANNGNALEQYEDNPDVIRAEYIAGTDPATGKYTGKYPATPLYYGMITPPILSLKLNGITYPNDNDDYYETYSFATGGQTVMNKINWGDLLNIKYQTFQNNNSVKFTIYKGEGDDINNWTRVCGYDGEQYDSLKFPNNAIEMHPYGDPTGDPFLQRDINNHDAAGTVGTYHIVPGYVYANNRYADGANYQYIIHDVNGDFEPHYYTQPDCTIQFKVTEGFNLHLRDWYGEKRMTNFPLPSDWAFPFDRKSQTKQEISYNFTEYSEKGDWKGTLNDVKVTCEYKGGDKYLITLSSMEISGKQIITHIYGKYENEKDPETGQEIWERRVLEETTTENAETNLTFFKNGEAYDTYFPTPIKGDFPFNSGVSGDQVRERWQLIEFKQKDGSAAIEKCTVKCTYANDVYSIQLIITEKTNTHRIYIYNYGIFTCGRNETKWVYQSGTGGVEIGTDIQSNAVVTVDNTLYNTFFPAPTDGSFPFSGSDSEASYNLQMYLPTDFDGTQGRSMEVIAIYNYSSGELELRREANLYYDNKYKITCYGKYQYRDDTKQWVQQAGYSEYIIKKWKTLAYFKIGTNEYQTEIPLPGESEFPSFTDMYEQDWTQFTYYEKGNTSGDGGFTKNSARWRYTWDNEEGYQLEIAVDPIDGVWPREFETYYMFKYNANQKVWVQVN